MAASVERANRSKPFWLPALYKLAVWNEAQIQTSVGLISYLWMHNPKSNLRTPCCDGCKAKHIPTFMLVVSPEKGTRVCE